MIYDPSKGVLTPLSYAHATCIQPQDCIQDKPLVMCECKAYNAIKCAGLSNDDQYCADRDTILDLSMTCMPCRFYTDNLHKFQGFLHNIQSLSLLAQNVKASLQPFNNPVVLLGLQNLYGTTKLSVSSENSLETNHITFQNGGRLCFANCQNGVCHAKMQNKKKYQNQLAWKS